MILGGVQTAAKVAANSCVESCELCRMGVCPRGWVEFLDRIYRIDRIKRGGVLSNLNLIDYSLFLGQVSE